MEIVLKRIAKKNTYTIGRLYILADEDVDRKVVTSYNQGLKREFRDSFDEQKLGADTYFCDTMEPTWRNLLGVELEPQLVDARLGRLSGKKALSTVAKARFCSSPKVGIICLIQAALSSQR